jgi:DNA-binding transcriptional LysR family regulator
LRTDDTEALLEAAVAGIGIVHLASWLVGDFIREGKLVSLFPEIPAPPKLSGSAIHAVRMPGRSHTTKAKLFISTLETASTIRRIGIDSDPWRGAAGTTEVPHADLVFCVLTSSVA